MIEEKKFKQVMTPHKKFMAEYLPSMWEFIKDDFKPEHMLEYGGQLGVYVYKRNFPQGNKILSCKIEFIEFEEDKINNTNKL